MKSNEEFIAGIYEKAAVYTEEKEVKVMKNVRVSKVLGIAAMAVLCIGLAGVGTLILNRGNRTEVPGEVPMPSANENYGIALTSELGENPESVGEDVTGAKAQLRVGPVVETVTFTGVVESIDTEENRIWLRLIFDETAPEEVQESIVCIRWDVLEKMSEELVVGTELTAMGVLSQYENEASEYHGCAELVLTDVSSLEIK